MLASVIPAEIAKTKTSFLNCSFYFRGIWLRNSPFYCICSKCFDSYPFACKFSAKSICCIRSNDGSRILLVPRVFLCLLLLFFPRLFKNLRLLRIESRGLFFEFFYLRFLYWRVLDLYLIGDGIGGPIPSKAIIIGFADIWTGLYACFSLSFNHFCY